MTSSQIPFPYLYCVAGPRLMHEIQVTFFTPEKFNFTLFLSKSHLRPNFLIPAQSCLG